MTSNMGTPENDLPRVATTRSNWITIWTPLWILGMGTVVSVKYRGQWDVYVSFHRWCADQGIPDSIRHFDQAILYAAAAVLGSLLVSWRMGGTVTGRLCLQHGHADWPAMVLVGLLPMIVGGVVLGTVHGAIPAEIGSVWPKVLRGVVRAPIAEELLFRGLLIGACAAAVGWRGKWFWCNAFAAALLFASIHVEWKANAIAMSWPALLVTGAGGLWYAWLLARWQTLWVPVVLHAGMNLGWILAGAGGGAGGGTWMENVLRVATIVIATWWTVRKGKSLRGFYPSS